MTIVIRASRDGDCDLVAKASAETDVNDLVAASGGSLLQNLKECVTLSHPHAWTICSDTKPIAMFGAIPIPVGLAMTGSPWLIASPEFRRNGFTMGRIARAWIAELGKPFEILATWADASREANCRFLEFCGFRRIREVEIGVLRLRQVEYAKVVKHE